MFSSCNASDSRDGFLPRCGCAVGSMSLSLRRKKLVGPEGPALARWGGCADVAFFALIVRCDRRSWEVLIVNDASIQDVGGGGAYLSELWAV